MVAVVLLSVIGLLGVSYLMGPPPMSTEQNTMIYSNNEKIIGVESAFENRFWIELDDISDKVIATTILIEDKHFYDHFGFDIKRIGGAILKNIQTGSLREGASTITQQLARNLYLTHEKTWVRKLKEAFYTIQLEMHYTKDEILEGYLNTIYYGHGAYGIETASQYFFGKSQEDLSYAEAAMLVGIPKGPTHYSPFNNEEKAVARKDLILKTLWRGNVIDDATYYMAANEKLEYDSNGEKMIQEFAGHFLDQAISEAAGILELPEEEIRSGGYRLYTTLDEDLQTELEEVIPEVIPEDTELETAIYSMDIHTGAVLALSGGKNYRNSEFNRATSAERMPGSSFKPFLYYTALESGYTPLTELMSKPTAFRLNNGEIYEPSNFNHYYAYEPINLAQAIALSDNVYAVRTNIYLGTDRLVETAKKFGIDGDLPSVPSLALGTAAVSLEELVNAYSMLGNGGKETSPYTIEKIIDKHDRVIYEREQPRQKQVLNEKTSFILTHLLSGIFEPKLNGYMPVTGSPISNQLSRLYAGKSGTTASDNWMVGYSPSIATGVWTGYDDNRTIELVQESTYAKEIWARVMEAAHKDQPQENFPVPDGVVGVPIDLETGLRATPYCGENIIMYFEEGTEPMDYCEPQINPDQEEDGFFKKWFQMFFG
nr:PBP1A family penicillin-binding protein [Oceanobacillus luteolus]